MSVIPSAPQLPRLGVGYVISRQDKTHFFAFYSQNLLIWEELN